MRNRLRTSLLVLRILVVSVVPVSDQTGSTGSLSGTVMDAKGAVVAGAAVKVIAEATNREFMAQTTPPVRRTFSVNGLPKGALNITVDGINVQDKLLKWNRFGQKRGDGFFTYVEPRTDANREVTVSTSTPGSDSSAKGAVQITFVTQGGSNEYHGGVYSYHRHPRILPIRFVLTSRVFREVLS